MKSYAFIVNATSGRGRAVQRAEALRKSLHDASSVAIFKTTHRGSAIALARSVADKVERIIAVGGDGTLNEVVDGLMTSGLEGSELPELGFLKAGTGNAVVKSLGLTSDPKSMARALMTAKTKPLDVGLARFDGGERMFLLWFGAGWDGLVIHVLNANRSGRMGLFRILGHVPKICRSMIRYRQPPINAMVNGKTLGMYANVIVANVGQIAFGGVVADEADPSDGRLDIVGIPRASILGLLRLCLFLVTSGLTRCQGVKHQLGTQVELQTEGDVPFQIDGEPVGSLPATISVIPNAVRFLMTQQSRIIASKSESKHKEKA